MQVILILLLTYVVDVHLVLVISILFGEQHMHRRTYVHTPS